jgi:hypothetical protein
MLLERLGSVLGLVECPSRLSEIAVDLKLASNCCRGKGIKLDFEI